MADKKCPTRDQLTTYVRGMLPHEQADEVTAHVATCTNCEDTVQALSSQSDSLISRIQKPAAAQPYVDEAACHKVVESVQRQTPRKEGAKPPVTPQHAVAATSASEPARTMNRNEFVEFITTVGFVSAEELATIEKQLSATDAADVQMLAKALVVTGKLTKFQAANIYQGKGKSLVFGEHVVLDRIGAGGMGQVYKAKHRRMDRLVALKVMSPAAMKNADSVRRFEREVRAAAKLAHPNIVHAYDAGVQDGVHFLVMEYVEGPDLSSLLKKQGKLPIKQACDFIAQAARGFAFAHGKGVVHRDIKPGNLLVDADGTVKVLDMGLARFDDGGVGGVMSEGELTQSGAVMGTVDYMAPEQAMNTRNADAKSDVYGLGCTLYRLLTGESVYGGQTMVEKIMAHREKPVPVLREKRPEAPPALEALIKRMLSKEPGERPSMQEAAETLTNIDAMPAITTAPGKSGIGIGAPPVQTLPSPLVGEGPGVRGNAAKSKPASAAPPKKRNRTPILAAAGAGALCIALGVIFVIRDKEGNKIAEVNAPNGAGVEMKTDPGPQQAVPPVATASPTTPQVATNDPSKMFALPTTGAPTPPPPTAITSPPPAIPVDHALERRAALRLLELGGTVSVTTPTRRSIQVRDPALLPEEPFTINAIDLRNRPITDADLAILRGLAQVNALRVPKTNVTDAGLAHVRELTTLTELRLSDNPFTDAGLQQLYDLTQLKLLEIQGTKISAAGTAAFQAKLPGCAVATNAVMAEPVSTASAAGDLWLYPETFNPQQPLITVPSLHYDGSTPLTVEAWVIPEVTPEMTKANAVIPVFGFGEHLQVTWQLSSANKGKREWKSNFYRLGSGTNPQPAMNRKEIGTEFTKEPRHVAVVVRLNSDGSQQIAQWADGKQLSTGTVRLVNDPQAPFISGGFIREMRVSKVERYRLEDFTPQPRWETDADTVALYHCDEGSGTQLIDSSGNGHHGTITGVAKWLPAGIPLGSVAHNGHFYKFVYDLHIKRSEAQAKCEEAGGYLACITSQAEHDFVKQQVAALTIPEVHKTMWLGGDSSSGRWQWISGEPWGFVPNDVTIASNFPYLKQFPDGRWSRESEASNKQVGGYIVEWNGTPTAVPIAAAMNNPSVATAPVTPPSVPTDEVDLLALVELPRDAVKGNWTKNGDTVSIRLGRGPNPRLQIPYAPPGDEYDLVLTGQMIKDQHVGIYFGMVRQGKPFHLRFGGISTGVSDGGLDALPNFTQYPPLPLMQPFTMLVEVRRNSLRAVFNGQEKFRYDGDFTELLGSELDLPRLDQMFLGMNSDTSFDFTSYKLKPIGWTATTTAAPSPPTAVGGLSPAAPVAPAAPGARHAVPTAAAQTPVLAVIKDVFKDDYLAARVPDKKSPLASKLLQQSATVVDPVERYVLLNEARTLAADGDDPQVLKQVLAALVEHFEVDPTQTVIDGWKAMLAKSRPAAVVRTIYDDLSGRFDAAVTDADFDTAKKYAEFANTTAPRLSDAAISKTARERLPALTARQTEYAAAKTAVEKLATAPDDAEANAVVGRYRATVENDWPNAFPLLAKGNQPPWKELAVKSLAAGADGASRAVVGDAWWDAAQANTALKPDLTAAALYWYQSSVNSLSGLNKTRVEKRLADGAALVRPRTIPPTLLAGDVATLRAGDTAVTGEVPKLFEFGGPKSTPAAPAAIASQNATLADPAFQQWVQQTADLPPAQKVDAFRQKMIELNPGFDGNLKDRVQNGFVTGMEMSTMQISNIAPVRVLTRVTTLKCNANSAGSKLADLTPLIGLQLLSFHCAESDVADLSPLRGMPLTYLNVQGTKVVDLSPIRGMQLETFYCHGSTVVDLSPLRGMPLKTVNLEGTRVTDLTPLHECRRLTSLNLNGIPVSQAQIDALRRALPALKIEGMPVATNGPAPTATGLGSTPREVALKVLANRGNLVIAEPSGAERRAAQASDLPAGEFTIVELTSNYLKDVTDADLQTLSTFKSLRRLTLANSDQLTGAGLVFLKDLPLLTKLSITRGPLQEAHWRHLAALTKLTELDISFTETSDAVLAPLFGLKSLTDLNLTKTKVSDAGAAQLQQALPQCKIVR